MEQKECSPKKGGQNRLIDVRAMKNADALSTNAESRNPANIEGAENQFYPAPHNDDR